ncbi:hypothetical protein ASPZODRAFT_134578 [Penicilliopsis zonata CBS 506.65]|uniref:Mid2 domain-containing protein n=1 Tax=Penicilliopsis zonata CBS 506.65 TaxID=1073090 RepID=A0A1L9SDC5_9EURO|nr:hypothetical protein ASPZODRAFT_134578 [Penicilliopsis zonata CBS 506.65]OJJ45181.1 hypothetical protein ASPZODRAFT_134578 [Penicilliopsis zonata CBS 506.65]
MTIFQTSPDGTPTATNIDCRNNWQAFTIYQELEVLFTTELSTASSTISTTPGVTTPSATRPSVTATTSPIPTAGPAGKSNKSWIAGAVIGPIAGIILATVVFWLRRRRARHLKLSSVSHTQPPPAELHEGLPGPVELPSSRNKHAIVPAELASDDNPRELP